MPCGEEERRRASLSRQIRRGGLHAMFIRPAFAAWLINHCVCKVLSEPLSCGEKHAADVSELAGYAESVYQ